MYFLNLFLDFLHIRPVDKRYLSTGAFLKLDFNTKMANILDHNKYTFM